MMKRARDVRDQLAGLMDRVEIEMIKSEDDVAIRKGHWVFDFSANLKKCSKFFLKVLKTLRKGHYGRFLLQHSATK